MRIINFISGKDLGGPKQSFILYSEALLNLGFQVNSVIRKGAPLKKIMHSMDIGVDEVSYIRTTHPWFVKKSIQNLRKSLLPMNASVVFVHKQLDIELVRGALGVGPKIIGIIHGFNAKHIKHADVLIAVSTKVKEFLVSSGYTKTIYVVPNMVKIGPDVVYRDLPAIPLIGAMGVFRRKKGFHILIKALSILKQRGVQFRAVIAGKGRITWYLQHLRWKLDLKKELTMRGWVSNNERDEFIDNIDLYVLPSRTETFGMVVVEAMARMKRVIATKCGGPEEIITDGIDGFLVEKESPEAMADKLEELIKNPNNSKAIPGNAYHVAIDKYAIDSVGKNLAKIITDNQ